jgi:cytochrome b6-f complex iron-sulfur subunit
MSNYHVEPASKPQALSKEAVKALRHEQVQGLSRRQVLRGSLAGGMLLWLTEVGAGSIGFLWPSLRSGFGAPITVGTLEDVKAQNSTLPIAEGFPAYYADARAFVALIDPATQQFLPGQDATGNGDALNVRALYQRCPHLGCRPNPCLRKFWLECPCHGSRYDRLGIRSTAAYGPAPRHGPLRHRGRQQGALTIAPPRCPQLVALGQPGLIPPKSPTGCI